MFGSKKEESAPAEPAAAEPAAAESGSADGDEDPRSPGGKPAAEILADGGAEGMSDYLER